MTESEREIERAREIVGLYMMDFEMYFAENDKYPNGVDGTFIEALHTLLDEHKQYRAIGTVSEFRELKEKATAKRPRGEYFGWTCPNCGEYHREKKNHCTECNQTILWT